MDLALGIPRSIRTARTLFRVGRALVGAVGLYLIGRKRGRDEVYDELEEEEREEEELGDHVTLEDYAMNSYLDEQGHEVLIDGAERISLVPPRRRRRRREYDLEYFSMLTYTWENIPMKIRIFIPKGMTGIEYMGQLEMVRNHFSFNTPLNLNRFKLKFLFVPYDGAIPVGTKVKVDSSNIRINPDLPVAGINELRPINDEIHDIYEHLSWVFCGQHQGYTSPDRSLFLYQYNNYLDEILCADYNDSVYDNVQKSRLMN